MMGGMKSRWMARLMTAVIVLATPVMALADDTPPVDARLQGYKDSLASPVGSTAFAWLVLVVSGLVCIGVMFMSAKRTHLD
jgi:hypothetical protein